MEAIQRHMIHNDWITRFYLSDYEYSTGEMLKRFNLTLMGVSVMILGLLTMVVLDVSESPLPKYNFIIFLKSIGLILLYLVLKYIIENLLASLFNIKPWYKLFAYVKRSYFLSFHLITLILLVPALYYFKGDQAYVYILGAVYITLILMRYIQTINFFSTDLRAYLFYFILYLCILEIAPLILIYKWVI